MKRKNYLLILIGVFLIITQSLVAQSNGPLFSLVAALTRTSITGEGDSWHPMFRGQAGVILTVANLSESMSFRVEVNGSLQGGKWGDNLAKGSFNLIYANAPLVLRYQHESGFFAEAGIQPGLLLSAKDQYSDGTTLDLMEDMKKFDFSIPVGIGYEFKNNFGVGLRLIPGLTNTGKGSDDKDRNFVVALRGTYTFNKK
jgi:hypothetical protein